MSIDDPICPDCGLCTLERCGGDEGDWSCAACDDEACWCRQCGSMGLCDCDPHEDEERPSARDCGV